MNTRVGYQNKLYGQKRIPILPREACAIHMLRKKFGYSIQCLAKFFDRSTSTVARILNFNSTIGALRLFDLRKLPTRVKALQARRQEVELRRYWNAWLAFMNGAEEKPP